MRATIVLFVVSLLAVSATAQSTSASVTGRVLDQTGAIILGAKVDIVSLLTNGKSTVETDKEGIYLFSYLSPGTYRILELISMT